MKGLLFIAALALSLPAVLGRQTAAHTAFRRGLKSSASKLTVGQTAFRHGKREGDDDDDMSPDELMPPDDDDMGPDKPMDPDDFGFGTAKLPGSPGASKAAGATPAAVDTPPDLKCDDIEPAERAALEAQAVGLDPTAEATLKKTQLLARLVKTIKAYVSENDTLGAKAVIGSMEQQVAAPIFGQAFISGWFTTEYALNADCADSLRARVDWACKDGAVGDFVEAVKALLGVFKAAAVEAEKEAGNAEDNQRKLDEALKAMFDRIEEETKKLTAGSGYHTTITPKGEFVEFCNHEDQLVPLIAGSAWGFGMPDLSAERELLEKLQLDGKTLDGKTLHDYIVAKARKDKPAWFKAGDIEDTASSAQVPQALKDLWDKCKAKGVTDEEAIGRMILNIRAGKFTADHYMGLFNKHGC